MKTIDFSETEHKTAMIEFISEVKLDVFDKDPHSKKQKAVEETFPAGERVEVDVLFNHPDSIDMQFADGSIAWRVPKKFMKVISITEE